MEKFIIEKSGPLNGEVFIDGAKNSVLPIIASTILTGEKCIIENIPYLRDVEIMLQILGVLGAEYEVFEREKKVIINCNKIINTTLPYELVKKIRASFLIAGPLLARFGKVKIQMPGGCNIGIRPIDLHLKGFGLLGASISQEHGNITITTKKLKGSNIYLDFPSVGATENIIMSAVIAEGETNISNCSVEPEIIDLADFLNKMGAKIDGAGTDNIKITGVKKLLGTSHRIIPDRIEAGTFMIGAVITKGKLLIKNIIPEHLTPIIAKLRDMNVTVNILDKGKNSIYNNADIEIFSKNTLNNTDIKTLPFPGFPTDMQAQFMALMAITEGTGIINETIFENRFMHAGELNRMGADIKIESKSAIIKGVKKLTGTQVKATDLRAGAALILSALIAEGETEISDIYHIERGYYHIEEKLQALGAKIKKI